VLYILSQRNVLRIGVVWWCLGVLENITGEISVSVRVQTRTYVCSLLTAITLTILVILDISYGCKNVRLGVNGNTVQDKI